MLPNPELQPLLRPADVIGLHPTLRRTAVYDALKKGEIPSIVIGSRIFIPTAALRRMLHLDEREHDPGIDSAEPRPDQGAKPDGRAEPTTSPGSRRGSTNVGGLE
ncbi:MAG: hypothetical protein ACTHMS_05280 [Jatrophihabitans sp.]|uniref:hypothetical protein n=1 Tax=Jatrophihabitans sp. TaxID=1932789 RepID=UPI003F7D0340